MHWMKVIKWFLVLIIVVLLILFLVLPFFREIPNRASLYYGSLFFIMLVIISIVLLFLATPLSKEEMKIQDYRVVHYTLRVALVLAIGAVILAILLMLMLFLN